MVATVASLIDLLDVRLVASDFYQGSTPDIGMPRVFGGQAAGQALMAAAKTVDERRVPHSVQSQFLSAGLIGPPIDFRVERLRDSGSFSDRRVVAEQQGRQLLSMQASFHAPENGPEHQLAAEAVDGPPKAGAVARPFPEDWPEFYRGWSSLEVDWCPDSNVRGPLTTTGKGTLSRFWMRTSTPVEGHQAVHSAIATCVSDLTLLMSAFTPHGIRPHRNIKTFTLDHCLWFHRPFRIDEWLRFDQVSPSASEGRAFCMGRFFDGRGNHVASVTQVGLIREW
jgi:acyl-CoA thioesterase-2